MWGAFHASLNWRSRYYVKPRPRGAEPIIPHEQVHGRIRGHRAYKLLCSHGKVQLARQLYRMNKSTGGSVVIGPTRSYARMLRYSWLGPCRPPVPCSQLLLTVAKENTPKLAEAPLQLKPMLNRCRGASPFSAWFTKVARCSY